MYSKITSRICPINTESKPTFSSTGRIHFSHASHRDVNISRFATTRIPTISEGNSYAKSNTFVDRRYNLNHMNKTKYHEYEFVDLACCEAQLKASDCCQEPQRCEKQIIQLPTTTHTNYQQETWCSCDRDVFNTKKYIPEIPGKQDKNVAVTRIIPKIVHPTRSVSKTENLGVSRTASKYKENQLSVDPKERKSSVSPTRSVSNLENQGVSRAASKSKTIQLSTVPEENMSPLTSTRSVSNSEIQDVSPVSTSKINLSPVVPKEKKSSQSLTPSVSKVEDLDVSKPLENKTSQSSVLREEEKTIEEEKGENKEGQKEENGGHDKVEMGEEENVIGKGNRGDTDDDVEVGKNNDGDVNEDGEEYFKQPIVIRVESESDHNNNIASKRDYKVLRFQRGTTTAYKKQSLSGHFMFKNAH